MRHADFRKIETERLILRDIRMEDVYEYYERLFGDGDVCRYLLFDPHQDIGESLAAIQDILQQYEAGKFYRWGITEKGEDSLIGVISLVRIDEEKSECSFAYLLGRDYWGKGYGTEALKAVISFAFEELEIRRIVADHMAENSGSGAVMRKVGMTHIGTEKGKYEKQCILHDAEIYEIRNEKMVEMTANDYQKQAMRTRNPQLSRQDALVNGIMGLCGESGEAVDILKKHLFHGHPLDRDALKKELGDIAWYLAETAWALDLSLEDVLDANIEKLRQRYPDGFETERSLER